MTTDNATDNNIDNTNAKLDNTNARLDNNEDATIVAKAENDGKSAVGNDPAEDTQAGYQDAIAQQQELINTLIANNQLLANQITQLVQGGIAISDGKTTPDDDVQAVDDYVSLADLGKEIGK